MSICATRAHYQPQDLAENDIKLFNFCQKATKAPEDVKRIEIDRTDPRLDIPFVAELGETGD